VGDDCMGTSVLKGGVVLWLRSVFSRNGCRPLHVVSITGGGPDRVENSEDKWGNILLLLK